VNRETQLTNYGLNCCPTMSQWWSDDWYIQFTFFHSGHCLFIRYLYSIQIFSVRVTLWCKNWVLK